MELLEAMAARHSVRAYEERAIDGETLKALQDSVEAVNAESGLHVQLVLDEPLAFSSRLAHYGKFSGVRHYLVMAGPRGPKLQERCGYYGEKLVLEAQRLGLNSCWVALTYKKVPGSFALEPGEKLVLVIVLGYGKTAGVPHLSKDPHAVSRLEGTEPEWFRRGLEAALLAPTAVNQQKFRLELRGDHVAARAGFGFCTKIDLGIVKYHFELGSGMTPEIWEE